MTDDAPPKVAFVHRIAHRQPAADSIGTSCNKVTVGTNTEVDYKNGAGDSLPGYPKTVGDGNDSRPVNRS